MTEFNLSRVFATVAAAVPDQEALVWRDRRLTYANLDARIDGVAHHLAGRGLGRHVDRAGLAGHEIGQDTVGLYLRNGNEYPEAMVAAYRAGAVPFNVNYMYVEEELAYLLADAAPTALVYHAEFAPRVAAVLERLPSLRVLLQVADDSGNDLLPGAVDYEAAVTTPAAPLPEARGEDAFLLYTGGTTGMPKGVLWRQHDVYVAAMGGRPFGSPDPFTSYEQIAQAARDAGGGLRLLMTAPFMHGAAQWSTFHMFTGGGTVVLPDNIRSMDAADWLRTTERERVGEHPGGRRRDGATPGRGDRAWWLRPVRVGSHQQRRRADHPRRPTPAPRGAAAHPHPRRGRLLGDRYPDEPLLRRRRRGRDGGVQPRGGHHGRRRPPPPRARAGRGQRLAGPPGTGAAGLPGRPGQDGPDLPGDRRCPVLRARRPGGAARRRPDQAARPRLGDDQLRRREDLRRGGGARAGRHPDVADVVVAGRPSERWGSEVVAIVALRAGSAASDDDLLAEAGRHVARYKLPKAIVRRSAIARSPSGKADYRWARAQAEKG